MSPVDRQKARRSEVLSLESSAKEGDLRMLSGSQALLKFSDFRAHENSGCVCLGCMEMGEERAS